MGSGLFWPGLGLGQMQVCISNLSFFTFDQIIGILGCYLLASTNKAANPESSQKVYLRGKSRLLLYTRYNYYFFAEMRSKVCAPSEQKIEKRQPKSIFTRQV